jgi:hypothetical protein
LYLLADATWDIRSVAERKDMTITETVAMTGTDDMKTGDKAVLPEAGQTLIRAELRTRE